MNHTHFQSTHNPFYFLLLLWCLLLTPLSAWAAVLAYVPNYSSNNVSVIDIATNTVLATVPVGVNPVDAAITPDGTKVYVTNNGSGTVSVINTNNNSVTTISNSDLSVGTKPYGVAITPNGTTAYVTSPNTDFVFALDINNNNAILAAIDVGSGSYPRGVAVTPNGNWVYVANANDTVTVIRTSDNTIVKTITLSLSGGSNYSIGVAATNSMVYVTNSYTNTVSVINASTNTEINTVSVEGNPHGITVTPDGTKVYVAIPEFGKNTVSMIKTSDNTVTPVAVGNSPLGVAVTPDGTKVYVTNSGNDTISVIETNTDTVMAGTSPLPGTTFRVGDSPNVNWDLPNALGKFIGQVVAPRYDSTPAPTNAIPSFSTTVSTPVTQNLTVQETGDATLNISSITVTDAAKFTVTTPTNFNINDGGSSQTVTIQCNSSTAGTYTATLNVFHNAMNSPATYTLSCIVDATPTPGYVSFPAPTATSPQFNFFTTAPANSTPQPLTIQETGTAQLDVTLSKGGTDPAGKFIISPALPSTFSIANGGADKVFTIQCDGSVVGTYTATLTATHNATGSPATYNLSCVVSATPTAAYTSTPVAGGSFDFTTTAFTNPSPQTLTVQNTGTATLNVTSIAIAGAGVAKFTVTPTSLSNINSGGTQNVTISCDGSTAGTYSAILTVAHNAGTSASYPLSCTVDKLDTTITLGSHDPDPSAAGQTVPIFFTVSPSTAIGNVSVKEGTTVLCTGTLTGGTGSCTHRFTAIGDYPLTAEYVGGTNYNGSLSSDVTHPVIDGGILFSTNTTDLIEGQEDSYTLQLATSPTSPIELTLTADAQDAQTEISLDDTNYAPTQTLSLTDTTAQTVYVRAIDDTQTEGNHIGKVTHTITQSTDTGYPKALKIPAFTVNITDNEPGVVITPITLTVTEGKTAVYAIKLASQPLSDVTITVTGNNQVQLTPTSLTFLADASALDPQTITVTAIDDQAVEGTHKATLTHAITTGDGGDYSNALTLNAVTININDNDSLTPTPPLPSDNQNTNTGNLPPPDNTPPRPFATLFVTVDGDHKGRVESSQGGIVIFI